MDKIILGIDISKKHFNVTLLVDNNVSAHAVRLLANEIISYNATILNIIYERLIAACAPKSVIDNFIRISPVAWEHISFTGRYNFTKDNTIVDLEKIVRFLEEKLNKNTKN
ncbi:MAG: Tn3 family transposase [Candidatus Marinimicrobia bacterium]|nr:Tn3 family transposase [Candidatus Neomarinimicrobiota bacterium]